MKFVSLSRSTVTAVMLSSASRSSAAATRCSASVSPREPISPLRSPSGDGKTLWQIFRP